MSETIVPKPYLWPEHGSICNFHLYFSINLTIVGILSYCLSELLFCMLLKDTSKVHVAVGGHVSHRSDQKTTLYLKSKNDFATFQRFVTYSNKENLFQCEDAPCGALWVERKLLSVLRHLKQIIRYVWRDGWGRSDFYYGMFDMTARWDKMFCQLLKTKTVMW